MTTSRRTLTVTGGRVVVGRTGGTDLVAALAPWSVAA